MAAEVARFVDRAERWRLEHGLGPEPGNRAALQAVPRHPRRKPVRRVGFNSISSTDATLCNSSRYEILSAVQDFRGESYRAPDGPSRPSLASTLPDHPPIPWFSGRSRPIHDPPARKNET
jgi:hypothetical protein